MPYCLCIYSVEGQARSEYEEKSLLLKKLGLTIKEMNEGINCIYDNILTIARCLKITEKVSFNIVSEASYIYILSGQKLILKMPKMDHFGEFFQNLKLAVKQCYQTGQF